MNNVSDGSPVLFLTYASSDSPRAEALGALLDSDTPVLLTCVDAASRNERDEPQARLQQLAFATVALLSSSTDSRFYLQEKIARAIELQRSTPDRHELILVFLDGIPTDSVEIPYALRNRPRFDSKQLGLPGVAKALREFVAERKPEDHSARAQPVTTAPIDRVQVYERLCQLLPTQFSEVLLRVKAPTAHLAPETQPRAHRAVDLIQWADQDKSDRLMRLSRAIDEVSRWPSPYVNRGMMLMLAGCLIAVAIGGYMIAYPATVPSPEPPAPNRPAIMHHATKYGVKAVGGLLRVIDQVHQTPNDSVQHIELAVSDGLKAIGTEVVTGLAEGLHHRVERLSEEQVSLADVNALAFIAGELSASLGSKDRVAPYRLRGTLELYIRTIGAFRKNREVMAPVTATVLNLLGQLGGDWRTISARGLFIGAGPIKRVAFQGADFREATFAGTEFIDCNFTGAVLRGANLSTARFRSDDGHDALRAMFQTLVRTNAADQPTLAESVKQILAALGDRGRDAELQQLLVNYSAETS